jgi:hypothetical protein
LLLVAEGGTLAVAMMISHCEPCTSTLLLLLLDTPFRSGTIALGGTLAYILSFAH